MVALARGGGERSGEGEKTLISAGKKNKLIKPPTFFFCQAQTFSSVKHGELNVRSLSGHTRLFILANLFEILNFTLPLYKV